MDGNQLAKLFHETYWSYHGSLPLPEHSFLSQDMKPDNYGLLNGRVVKLDYPIH